MLNVLWVRQARDSLDLMDPAAAQNPTQPPTVQPAPNPIHEAEQRAAEDIVRALCDARDRSRALESLRVELIFPDMQEAHLESATKSRSSRSVSVQFLQRTTSGKKKCLTLEIGTPGAVQKLRLRVELKPQREVDKPAEISVQLVAKYRASGAENTEEAVLTNSYVSMLFKLDSGGAESDDFSDDQPLALNNVQSLGPMLAGLQDVWFKARDRKDAPNNVAFFEHNLSQYWVQGEERWSTWQPDFSEITNPIEREEEAGRFLAALTIWRCIAALYVVDKNKQSLRRQAGLPDPDEFFPNRPVDLIPDVVREHLEKQTLRVPWHVIEAACKSLNAGKHVIFTGPPGCGKTELAAELALLATGSKRDGLIVTASPQWSSAELVGRYVPKRLIYGLDFAPGFFLRAIEQRRWLVIDEFNRAPIDACFGELFTVLSGQTVELPFEEESANGTAGRVRVIPAIRSGTTLSAGSSESAYRDYPVPADFRIIGTMNDADRSDLNRLSFALLPPVPITRETPPLRIECRQRSGRRWSSQCRNQTQRRKLWPRRSTIGVNEGVSRRRRSSAFCVRLTHVQRVVSWVSFFAARASTARR
jgi:hypothetical protein